MRILLSLATAITILAAALLLLFTPIWTHFALGAVGNGSDLQQWWSDQTINQVVSGPGDFEIDPCSPTPVTCAPPSLRGSFYTEDEKAHMRDVRVVFYGFLVVAVASLVFTVVSLLRAPRDAARWKAVARGGIWLIVGILVIGGFAFIAFDTVFTLFHEIFFPGGNWAFPADSNLIRLYPEPFWELCSLALGTLSIVGGLGVWFVARRRANAVSAA